MDEQMLEQIQQMITTANESLARHIRQEMGAMESRLGERIDETKRHSGVLAEDLHHKLDLVIEGQQFLGHRIDNVQADMDSKNRETRTFLELSYRQLNERIERHEQRHHT